MSIKDTDTYYDGIVTKNILRGEVMHKIRIRFFESDTLKKIEAARVSFQALVIDEKKKFEDEVRRQMHNAYAGIVCASCGKNVFRGEGTWVHGNNGKAYCLEPCWSDISKQKEVVGK